MVVETHSSSSLFFFKSKVIGEKPAPVVEPLFDIRSFCYPLGHLIDSLRYLFYTFSVAAQSSHVAEFSRKGDYPREFFPGKNTYPPFLDIKMQV